MLKNCLFDLFTSLIPRIAVDLAKNLHREFNFDVVVSSQDHIPNLPGIRTGEDTSHRAPWTDKSTNKSILFIPPADEPIERWLAKAIYESRKGATVIGILPVRADKEYFHKYLLNIAAEVRFLRIPKSNLFQRAVLGEPLAVVVFKSFKGSTRFTSALHNGEVIEHLN